MKLILAASIALLMTLSPGLAVAESPPAPSYAVPLGLSYLVLPVLVPSAIALDGSLAIDVSAAVIGLAAPVTVHALNGEPQRAVLSPFAAIGTTVLGGLAGLGVGALIATGCPPTPPTDEEYDPHSDCGLKAGLVSVSVGALAGYAGWAIYDTVAHSSPEQSEPAMALAPLVTRTSTGLELAGVF